MSSMSKEKWKLLSGNTREKTGRRSGFGKERSLGSYVSSIGLYAVRVVNMVELIVELIEPGPHDAVSSWLVYLVIP